MITLFWYSGVAAWTLIVLACVLLLVRSFCPEGYS
jgi:hypothetical protein